MLKKKLIAVLGVVCLAVAAVFAVQAMRQNVTPQPITAVSANFATVTAEPEQTAEPDEEAETAEEPEATAEPYVSPLDFAALQEVNEDIYAWIYIEDTNIDLPVLQHPTDNSYYLTHNSDGAYSANGSVYSELYNATDFSDPVTVLYGHHMSSGAIFGYLESYYSDSEFFASHPTITIYTEQAELTYQVFAAVPYSNSHLLYNNDFTDADVFAAFFAEVMTITGSGCNFNEEYMPDEGSHVLILSTCLASDNTCRYLVMATLAEDAAND